MLPLVINNNPGRLVQVTNSGMVGVASPNARNDALLVQSLLNAIPSMEGGPQTKLTVDGVIGPKSIAAIQGYQRAKHLVVDGKIGANGPTLKSLVTTLNDRNALPAGLPNIGQPSPEITRVLNGGGRGLLASRGPRDAKASTGKGGAFGMQPMAGMKAKAAPATVAASANYTGPTGWSFVTSSSLDISVKFIGVTVINMVMQHDVEPGLTYTFSFAGSGVGLSSLPAGLDFSVQDFPSYGTRLMKYNPVMGSAPPMYANAFDLLPTIVFSAGVNVPSLGWSGTAALWGAAYACALTGMQAGAPAAGINLYVGAIAGWM